MSRLLRSLGTTEALSDLFSDASVLGAMLDFEAALARAQARCGGIPETAAEAIAKAAVADGFDIAAIAREARRSASLVIPLVGQLRMRAGEAGRYVHAGATSQDVIDSALMLLLQRARKILAADHARLEESLRALSDRHARTPMLGRTLLQPALPITFGYKVAIWYGGVHRSWRRLCDAFAEAVTLQFGGVAGTLAAHDVAVELANQLGLPLSRAPWHTARDRLAAFVAHCGIYVGALGKMARDIALLMQAEVGELAEPGGGSSALPNKCNPSGSAIVLAAATRLPGLAAAYLAGMVQEHERAVGGWQAEWETLPDVVETTGSALAAAAGVIGGLTVFPERMLENLGGREIEWGAAEEFRSRLLED
ncbi:MAG TPA: 3-carboxy-cis,cis-muconate cycloisomerase [Bryobacteraceae bacterium]|nr:3-carboxy-cis,cis-muconate cycloisomerase [Bryobacteraceae bacterium]